MNRLHAAGLNSWLLTLYDWCGFQFGNPRRQLFACEVGIRNTSPG
jgi:hypothetical protein